MCFDYDEYIDVWVSNLRKARKHHKCTACGGDILPGDFYNHVTGIFDGGPFTEKFCGSCEADRDAIHFHELAEGCGARESWIVHDEIPEYMRDHELKRTTREDGQKWLVRRKKQRELATV